MRRLSGRRTCVKNGHVYHVEFDPPKNEGVCDQDGSRLVQRDDDKPETVQKRLAGLPRADRAADRLVRGARPAAPIRRHCARPRRSTATSVPHWLRWLSRTRSDDSAARPRGDRRMAAAGRILARCHEILRSKARPGVTTADLDDAAERFIRSQGAEPAFKGYRGFPGSICASPNSMVVHGIPGRVRAEARRHPLDRHRRGAGRLGGGRGDHPPDRERHARSRGGCWPPPAARCSTPSSSAGRATAWGTSRTRCRPAWRATGSR